MDALNVRGRRYLHKDKFYAAGLDKIMINKPVKWPPYTGGLQVGDLFTCWNALPVQRLQIYHNEWRPAPSNTWIEVEHLVIPTELQGSWIYPLRGTNVWFNVGRTVVFPRDGGLSGGGHDSGVRFLATGCSRRPSNAWPQYESDVFGFCAREKVRTFEPHRAWGILTSYAFHRNGQLLPIYALSLASDLIASSNNDHCDLNEHA
eukprot:COSAG02_NODE_4761_length_5016_cov_3.037014_2_plen_204_part_00